jgi:hypothetical protein
VREHAAEIRRVYGYRDFSDPGASLGLVRWLYQRSWLSTDPPSVLFDLATAWLVERQLLLSGVTVPERLVTRIRERANVRLYRTLAALPSEELATSSTRRTTLFTFVLQHMQQVEQRVRANRYAGLAASRAPPSITAL